MALSGSKTVTATKYNKLVFSWTATQSVSGNYSNVSWKLKLTTTGSGEGHISSSSSKKYSVTVNGTTKSGTNTIGVSAGSSKTLASGTVKVNHNSNGTKTFSVSFSQEFNITFSGSHIGTIKGSASFTLNTIPRASSMSVPNITIGSAGTITVSKASSGFSHTITATFGSYSKTIVSKGTGTSYSFTPPMEWCNAVTGGTSATATYKIYTYSGSTHIGTKTYEKTLYIPSSVVPTISSVSHSEASLSSGWSGVYVKTKSKIQFRISCAGSYGSTIKSIITKYDGQTLSGTPSPSANCNSAGAVAYTVTVTDSRGRTASKSGTINVMDYSSPQLISFSAFRCNESGKADDNGERLSISKRFAITQLNNINTNKWKIEYKESGASSYSLLTSGSGYSINDTWISGAVFSVDKAYLLKITVEDSFHVIPKEIEIPTAFTLIDYNDSGKGIKFGGVSEKNGFVVDMDLIEFENSINVNKHIYLPTTGYLCNKSEVDGATFVVAGMTTSDQILLGYSSRDLSRGATYLDGHNIYERSNGIINMSAGTCGMELGHGNEINFSSSNSTICFGYRSIGGNTPSSYAFFNGSGNYGSIYCGTIIIPSTNCSVMGKNIDSGKAVNMISSTRSDNVYIGGGSAPPDAIFLQAKGNSNVFGISNDGQERMYFVGAYNRTYTSNVEVVITSAGTFGRYASSSRKYKTDIISIEENLKKQRPMTMMVDDEIEPIINPDGLYEIPVMQYKYIDGYLAHDDKKIDKDIIGIMAEDVAKYYPTATIYDDDGNPEAWQKEPILVGMLYLLQKQKKEIDNLKEIVKGLTV